MRGEAGGNTMSARDNDPFLWRAAIATKILCAIGIVAMSFLAGVGLRLVVTALIGRVA